MEMEDGSEVKEGNGQATAMPSCLERMQNKLKCSFCTRAIGKSFFVKCAVCESVLLCADCFVAGVRLPPHNNSHPYRVAECLDNISIFQKDWSAKEELLLLEGNGKVFSLLPSAFGRGLAVGAGKGIAPLYDFVLTWGLLFFFFFFASAGILRHGMGNWKVIADAMDTNKTAKQVVCRPSLSSFLPSLCAPRLPFLLFLFFSRILR